MKKKVIKKHKELEQKAFELYERSFEELSSYDNANLMNDSKILNAKLELLDELLENDSKHSKSKNKIDFGGDLHKRNDI